MMFRLGRQTRRNGSVARQLETASPYVGLQELMSARKAALGIGVKALSSLSFAKPNTVGFR